MSNVSSVPEVAMTHSTMDDSQPIGAPSPKSAMKQEKHDCKTNSKDKLSRPQAALMFFALALAVFAGDFLLLGRTKSSQPDFSWKQGWQKILSWACSEVCAADCVLLFSLVSLIAYHVLYRNSDNSIGSSTAQLRSSKTPTNGVRRREAPKQNNAKEDSTCSQREAGVRSPERSMAERSNAVLAKWNQMIDYAARQGDPSKAGKLLMEFERQGLARGHKPDVVSFNLVIRAYAKKADVHGAERWFVKMEESGVQATLCSYNTLLDACAKADDAEACERWLRCMLDKKIEANVISYATAIYAWARRGEEAQAEKWFQAMINNGISPDAVSYNSMIHACGVAGHAEGAERWIQEMRSSGLEATVTTFTTVIDACAKGGDVPRAEKWLEAMITSQVQPNVVSFSAMIDACAKACDPTRAEYWHNRMVECNVQPNAHSYSAVINACAKAGDVGRAEGWLGKSEQAGVATDVVVYSSVIDACGKVGDAERAKAVFHRMQVNGIRPHIVAYAALARPYAYRGDWGEVERIAKEMAERGISKNEYFLYAQLLAYASARPRQDQRAEFCFRNALEGGLKPNDHVVVALARAVGRARCTELMVELCNGRAVPHPPQRREGGVPAGGNRSRKSCQT